MNQRESDVSAIKQLIAEKDSRGVEDTIQQLIGRYPQDEEIILLICEIFASDWHTVHEDMALGFQYIKNPLAARTLYNVALSGFAYCAWDDNYALQRKCTWALADIGTDEAKAYLHVIEKSANPVIAAFAAKRLKNWDSELGRKGISQKK